MVTQEKKPINIFWFRRDLRLDDNLALYHALQDKYPVLPIFIFDKNILSALNVKDARVSFIHQTLEELRLRIQKNFQSDIALFYDAPLEVFHQLESNYKITTVFTNDDYEPYAIQRDNLVKEFLNAKGIGFRAYKDHVIFEKNEVVKSDGSPYVVYTPYMKLWKHRLLKAGVKSYNLKPFLKNLVQINPFAETTLEYLGFKKSHIKIKPFQLDDLKIEAYGEQRNYPALNATSLLGPHLRFGTISIRRIIQQTLKRNNDAFLNELVWREFFIQILWHFPNTVHRSFKPKYDYINWRNNEKEFKLWCEGKTGYAMVDAGMHELNTTGYMHNRARMVAASFLCKHLLIDWRWGESYFAQKLNDFELASNIGNWQWVAGSGVDAAPYFRIFNPITQREKFDQNHQYVKRFIPDYDANQYIEKVIDHRSARQRCLEVYKKALINSN